MENGQHDSTFLGKSETVLIMTVDLLMCKSPPNKRGTRVIDDVINDSPLVGNNSTLCGGYHINMT